jgi:hypothetical protein
MRPMNHAALALLQAANRLSAAGRGVTLAEMRQDAKVSEHTARMFVPSLARRGHLKIIGERKVTYRNRPVAEYMPVPDDEPARDRGQGCLALVECLRRWGR